MCIILWKSRRKYIKLLRAKVLYQTFEPNVISREWSLSRRWSLFRHAKTVWLAYFPSIFTTLIVINETIFSKSMRDFYSTRRQEKNLMSRERQETRMTSIFMLMTFTCLSFCFLDLIQSLTKYNPFLYRFAWRKILSSDMVDRLW